MAVAYDNVVATADFGVTTITTTSFAIGAGSDRAAIVVLSTLVAPGTISALSLGGVNGTFMRTGNDGTWFHSLYKVLNPPSGSQTGTATWANSTSGVLTIITATGASDVNNDNYAQAGADNVSINISSNSGDLTATFSGDGNTGTTHSTNQTQHTSGELVAADTGPGTAGPITHTWTHTGAFSCNAIGANFIAAGGGGTIYPVTLSDTLTMFENIVQDIARYNANVRGILARIVRRIQG